MRISNYIYTDKFLNRLSWILAISIVIAAGMIYRFHASLQELVSTNALKLTVPLRSLPFKVNEWFGRDVPIAQNIQKASGNDDFINRLYVNESTNQWANVYVVYSGQPRIMLGHRPEVCYVGGGWAHESTVRSQFLSSTGRVVPCLVHRFYKPNVTRDEIVVLNFYILNGQVTSEEKNFSGLDWRVPNIGGVLARYVAQVQISSVLENSVRSIAEAITEPLLDFFPDEDGRIKVAGDDKNVQAVQENRKYTSQ